MAKQMSRDDKRMLRQHFNWCVRNGETPKEAKQSVKDLKVKWPK